MTTRSGSAAGGKDAMAPHVEADGLSVEAPAGPSATGAAEKGRPRKHSFSIAGHRTSISLEAEFWDALRDIAGSQRRALAAVVADIDRGRGDCGLSGAIRVFVLEYYRSSAAPQSSSQSRNQE